jgi:hypothetical protein
VRAREGVTRAPGCTSRRGGALENAEAFIEAEVTGEGEGGGNEAEEKWFFECTAECAECRERQRDTKRIEVGRPYRLRAVRETG